MPVNRPPIPERFNNITAAAYLGITERRSEPTKAAREGTYPCRAAFACASVICVSSQAVPLLPPWPRQRNELRRGRPRRAHRLVSGA